MELPKRVVNYLNQTSTGKKICILFIAIHLDESLERSYLQLKRKFNRSRSIPGWDGAKSDIENYDATNADNLDIYDKERYFMRLYRWLTNIVHSVNIVKFLVIILIAEAGFWPLEWNCRIPGRLHLHSTFTDHNHILAFAFTLIVLVWRYLITVPINHHELLNLLLFSFSDDATIDREHLMVKRLNHQMRDEPGDDVIELQTILQQALFYRLDTDEFRMYRLRPNRTRAYRRQLDILINTLLFTSFLAGLISMGICIPLMLQCLIFDVYYARTYATCCPGLDRLAARGNLSRWQWSLHGCDHLDRVYFLPFDLLDTFSIMFGAGGVYVLPMAISTFITGSMIIHWRYIDERIKSLLARYKQLLAASLELQFRIDPVTGCVPQLSSAEALIAARRGWQRDRFLAIEKADLQAIIVDFFESFRRMNRLGGTLISYGFIIFANGVLVFAYFSYRSPNFYRTLIGKFLMSALYLTFFANSIIVLELNRVIDHSYTNICSIMALDGSQEAIKWSQIIDIYSHRVGTVYSIIGIKINWHLVTSLAASSISFLVVVASYRNYHNNRF